VLKLDDGTLHEAKMRFVRRGNRGHSKDDQG